jgi:hypothetical protein
MVRAEGDVFLCCPGWLDTPIGNIQFQSVRDVWNSEKAQGFDEQSWRDLFDIAIFPSALSFKQFQVSAETWNGRR